MLNIDTRSLLLSALFLVAGPSVAQVPQLYGMASSGGAFNKGSIFKVSADGSGFAVVFSFDSISGYAPEGSLCLAPNNKLYGMTNLGGLGSIAVGTLFSFDPVGNVFHKIVDFDMSNGGFGWGTMTLANDNMLYGATYGGGGSGGSIFRLDPSTDTYTIINVMDQTTDGGSITDRLIQANDGKLYGLSAYGGANSAGVIFSYDPSADTYANLHDFDNLNGSTPYGSLCEADNGFLYGMTYEGGADGDGVFFTFDPTTSTFTKLFDFNTTNGQNPWTSMVRYGPDKLFGNVTLGGTPGTGLIFSFIPSTETYTIEHSFNSIDGGLLFGSMILGSDGQFYGMSNTGGVTFQGNAYRFDPATSLVTTVHSFIPTEALAPRGDLVQFGTTTSIAEETGEAMLNVYPNPASSVLHVDGLAAGTDDAIIMDVAGRSVSAPTVRDRCIDVSGLNGGIYFIRFARQLGSVRFIKD